MAEKIFSDPYIQEIHERFVGDGYVQKCALCGKLTIHGDVDRRGIFHCNECYKKIKSQYLHSL